jgi:hypothetical protein
MLNTQRLDKHESSIAFGPPERLPGGGSVRLHGRRVTKVGLEVKHGLFRVVGARNPKRQPRRAAEQGCEAPIRALPDISSGGERYDRFGVVVGEGSRIEVGFAPRSVPEWHAQFFLLPEPEMAGCARVELAGHS